MANEHMAAAMNVAEQPLVYPAPAVEIRVRQGIAYRSEAAIDLHADVYRPANLREGELRAAVVFIHGGPIPSGANPKDWRVFRDYGNLVAANGLIGITFNHRLHSPVAYATAQEDVAALLDYVRSHAEELNVDPDRLVLWAFSGGGPLLTVGLASERTYVRGLIAYYALLDFVLPAGLEVNAEQREVLDRMSPLVQLRRHGCRPCVFIARAGLEAFPGLNDTQHSFFMEALAQNVAVEFINHPQGEHGFDIRNEVARTPEIIDLTLAFLRARAK